MERSLGIIRPKISRACCWASCSAFGFSPVPNPNGHYWKASHGLRLLCSTEFQLSDGAAKLNQEIQKMFSKIRFAALSAAFVLSTAFPASAATKHHRVTQAHRAFYNMVPDTIRGTCSPTHAPLCSNICTGTGPCAPPDSW
jgi:hypothetical protein